MVKTTKSGNMMSRQAHMELLIKEGKNPGLGDTIFYVNNGEKKSHGDVQKKEMLYNHKPIPVISEGWVRIGDYYHLEMQTAMGVSHITTITYKLRR